ASQPGSDVVWELCELIQKCSECIWWQNLSQNRACTEDEEDLEDDQLLCSQQSNEDYFADTEDCSSVSSGSDSPLSDSEKWDESLSASSYDPDSEGTMQDTLSTNFSVAPNNAEVEQTNQDVAQENSHSQEEIVEPTQDVEQEQTHSLMEVVEPTQDVEQDQLVREICPSWSPLEGGGHFQISVKKDLSKHVKSGYAFFGDELVNLENFNSLTWKGVIPASQEPGVVAVHVFSDTTQFLGKTTFTYEDMRKNVVSQAVDQGGDGLSDLLSLIAKHVWSQSSSMKQNSEQATGALNGSCQKRPSPAENNIMDDKCEDFGQYFQDIVKWLSEESFHPGHSNTDVWLKLSKAIYGLCKKLDSAGDEQNFTSDQHASPQESEASYFADAETSSCTSSNSASSPDPEDWSQPPNAPLTGFISQPSVPKTEDDGNEKHPWWNKSSSEPHRTDDNLLNDDYNAVEDITKKFESFPALQNDTDHHRDSELNTASTWGKDKKTPAVQECEETAHFET
ncbi:uncharacterized protein LOC111346951, partial [Stylophora pistillata]|uniref:uncharacterized protein LOC111346951 n=1 Tax=Stylophora pistillata TaxID=50429 RepID=UPI000C057B58